MLTIRHSCRLFYLHVGLRRCIVLIQNTKLLFLLLLFIVVVWRSGSVLVSINKVNLRRARLVLGWVTVIVLWAIFYLLTYLYGFNSR